MIELDYRRGSGELEKGFLAYGIRVHKKTLEYGDFAWEGNGPNGRCFIGAERKLVADMIDSMQTDRLAGHQAQGMRNCFDRAYLLLEGIWRVGDQGEVLLFTGKDGAGRPRWRQTGTLAEALINFIATKVLIEGFIPWKTASAEETTSFVVAQYHWWQKPWADHRSHDAIYIPQVKALETTQGFFRLAPARTVTKREEFAYGILPGLGDDKARWAAKHFQSIYDMTHAKAEEWGKMEWRTKAGKVQTVGVVVAKKIVDCIRGNR